jgi:hypothetical protein
MKDNLPIMPHLHKISVLNPLGQRSSELKDCDGEECGMRVMSAELKSRG